MDLCGDLCPACHLSCELDQEHSTRRHPSTPDDVPMYHVHEFDYTSLGQSNQVKHVTVRHSWFVVSK